MMISLEPVRLKSASPFHTSSFSQTYELTFSCFKEQNKYSLSHIIKAINSPFPPHVIVNTFDEVEGVDAERFLLTPLVYFKVFKRAILLFEKKAYTLDEFEQIMKNWKESLKQ